MKYVIYQRVSTDEQSVENQEFHCLNYIKSISGNNPFTYEVYSDEGVSTSIKAEKRLGLQAALKALKKGDTLLILRLDRISRNLGEFINICEFIEENKKAKIVSVKDPWASDRAIRNLLACVADMEKANIRNRTKENLSAKKARSERVGRVPYGFRLSEKLCFCDKCVKKNPNGRRKWIEPCPIEQETLSKLYHLKQTGLSYRELEDYCENHQIRNRQGHKFYHKDLWVLLKDLNLDCKSNDSAPTHSRLAPSLQCV